MAVSARDAAPPFRYSREAMNDSGPLSLGALLGNKYRLDRLLGQGGMGAVYQAENVDIGRRVAVKVLLPEVAADADALARFRTEARAAAAIGHPGIAEVIDFGTTPEGGAYLVMEYLEGETLGARLRRAGPLDVETVGWLADELLAAVAAAHGKGVIHRDLKPDNVFLVEQPVRAVKVLDFGISKFHHAGQPHLTRTGTVMGTPAYMSPEQARGAKDVGPQSDLYAVGALLFEALTGTPAFPGESYNEILAKVLTEPHPSLRQARPDAPPALVAAVDRLLSKAVADRPADAQEARALLGQAMKGGGMSGALGAPTLRPGSLPPAESTPAFAPTARTPAARPPPAAAPPPPAPPQPSTTKEPARRPFWKYALWAFLILVALRGCSACRSCCRGDDDDRRRERREARKEALREADEALDADAAGENVTLTSQDLAKGLKIRVGDTELEVGPGKAILSLGGGDAGAAGPDAGPETTPDAARAPARGTREVPRLPELLRRQQLLEERRELREAAQERRERRGEKLRAR